MLAVFQVYLPSPIFLPADAQASLPIHQGTIGDIVFEMSPPYSCGIKPSHLDYANSMPLIEVTNLLDPITFEANPSTAPKINDEDAAICNALQLTLSRSTFDREPGKVEALRNLAFSLVNDWLARLRILSRAAHLASLSPVGSIWRLMYRADDGSELERDPRFLRAICGGTYRIESVAMNPELWDKVAQLQWGFTPRGDDLLLLDAQKAVEDVGPALVLAFTAIETRISTVLDRLSELYGMPRQLWLWVNDRKDYTKAPSTLEQFDTLLSALTGRSLKEDARLWEGFQNLRRARNSFVHNGQGVVGQDAVDAPRAANLVAIAEEIMDWVDALLPENERRPKFDSSSVRMQMSKLIVAPDETDVTDGTAVST